MTRLVLTGVSALALVATAAAWAALAQPAEIGPSGIFDIGDHSLYMRCEGTGNPTVIHLHGLSEFSGPASSSSARQVPVRLRDDYRICIYDRANTGASDNLPGPRTGEDAINDLHALLAVTGIEPPYVLLGASFGGILAYMYAMTWPDEVVGMVLLDASFPDEIELEPLWPEEDRYNHDDWADTEELVDFLAVHTAAHALRGNEAAIPVVYLLATPSTWTGPPAYEAVVLDAIRAYVASFSPGIVREVESEHWMENAVPQIVADAVREVIGLANEAE